MGCIKSHFTTNRVVSMATSQESALVMERLCGPFYVGFYLFGFNARCCFFSIEYLRPHRLLDNTTGNKLTKILENK